MAAEAAPLPNLYQQSVTFAGALQALLEIIEEVDLNDGQYLTACNALKFLHDLPSLLSTWLEVHAIDLNRKHSFYSHMLPDNRQNPRDVKSFESPRSPIDG